MNDIRNIRAAFRQAVDHLVTRHHCTPREAQRRIYQRARAKKAELGHVARMIVAGQAANYHCDVPLTTCTPEHKEAAQSAPSGCA